jgi:hypothetical protein
MAVVFESKIDIARACLICATRPVPATVYLDLTHAGALTLCELHVEWPDAEQHLRRYPPPVRFTRGETGKKKRCISADNQQVSKRPNNGQKE